MRFPPVEGKKTMLTMVAVLWISPLPAFFSEPPEHATNTLLTRLRAEGFVVGRAAATFPEFLWRDGDSFEIRKAAFRKAAGSVRRAEELLRDSPTAPHLLKLHDLKSDPETILRVADVLFVVHADFKKLDLDRFDRLLDRSGAVEAGNMRFESEKVARTDLRLDEPEPKANDANFREEFVHVQGRLLDRILFETTDRIVVTRSNESIVAASRTLSEPNEKSKYPNIWRKIFPTAGGRPNAPGSARKYQGGAAVLKISQYAPLDKILVVEARFVFAEPRDWFDGAPTLRSKIGLAVQDQIRRLRREIAARRKNDE